MQDDQRPTDQDQEDFEDLESLEENDEIIGVAMRRSLLVLAVAAGLVALFFVVRVLLRAEPEDSVIEAAGPLEVEAEAEQSPPDVRFVDITAAAGIDFVHENGATGDRFLPETMGGGVAILDYDQDGDQDLLFVNSREWSGPRAGTSRLYENDGSGSFTDRTQGSGLDFVAYGTAPAVGDVDNDGFPDVFVAAVGNNRLLMNEAGPNGGRRFVDRTERAGVAGASDRWSSTSAFFDADNDGDLDLFVGNYVEWSRDIDLELDYRLVGVGRAYGQPVNYRGTLAYFYRNRGDGRFDDVSAEAGVEVRNPASDEPVAKALGLAPADIDGDGLIDVVVANDTVRNFYFQNTGGSFEELGEIVGLAYGRQGEATGAMGIDAAYVRGGEDFAVGIGNFANEMSSYYVSQGSAALFADESISVGVGAPSRRVLSFGFFFFDVDLDGRLDLLQVNGHLENEISKVEDSQTYEQLPQLFWNAGPSARRTYMQLDEIPGLDQAIVGRGSAFGDLDGDGDLDAVLLQTGGAPLVLRNETPPAGDWLRVRLVGNGSSTNRDAIGAWLRVVTKDAAGQQFVALRQVMPTRSYQSQSELPITLGLGEGRSLEAVSVFWPGQPRTGSGQLVDLALVALNGDTTLRQP